MTPPRFDDQRLVYDELEARLATCTPDGQTSASDWLDLAGLVGQGRRLCAHLDWDALQSLCEQAGRCIERNRKAIEDAVAMADLEVPLDALVLTLADPDPDLHPILDALYQLDLAIMGVAEGGRLDRAEALADSAASVLAAFPEAASLVSDAAARFLARHGETGPSTLVWQTAADAEQARRTEDAQPKVQPPDWLYGMLAASAASGERDTSGIGGGGAPAIGRAADNVIAIRFAPASTSPDVALRAAASTELYVPEGYEVARSAAGWSLVVVARPGGARLELYAKPADVDLSVTLEDEPLRVGDDGECRFVDVPIGSKVHVSVADEAFTLQVAEAMP